MNCRIKKWQLSDAKDLAIALFNKKYRIIFETDYCILVLYKKVDNLSSRIS